MTRTSGERNSSLLPTKHDIQEVPTNPLTRLQIRRAKESRVKDLQQLNQYSPENARTFHLDYLDVVIDLIESPHCVNQYLYTPQEIRLLVAEVQGFKRGPTQGYYQVGMMTYHFNIHCLSYHFEQEFLESLQFENGFYEVSMCNCLITFKDEGDLEVSSYYQWFELSGLLKNTSMVTGHIKTTTKTISFCFKPHQEY
ncbi:hypothetical protein K7432_001296 [Basidiobolus ranarum]|uniref:Uncharacterized protein n=1 Tax=Basidiobolus ranarum TaxID=34480 RepID=A0ABR2X367_9FUNG